MIDDLIARLQPLRPPAPDSAIAAVERSLGRRLPDDYRWFLRRTNGFEGALADGGLFVQLARIEELPGLQRWGGEVDRPDLVWFGGDGGGSGYFFDYADSGAPVLMIEYVSDWREDALRCGDSFTDFLERAGRGWSPRQGDGAQDG